MKAPALALLFCLGSATGQVTVATGQYNLGRTNANQSETVLNTSNVNSSQFGLLYSRAVDGQVYAQPLYIPNVTIQSVKQNVIYVATLHNSVYAFSDNASVSTPLWQVNLGPSAPFNFPQLQPECGIMSTPVIDPSSGTMYVVAETLENGTYIFRLHALDITNGAEKFNGPVVIQASVRGTGFDSVNGTVTFHASTQLQRPALLLLAGSVYIGFGTASPVIANNLYHGWLMAYDSKTLALKFAFNTTPNGGQGGIWMSGVGPAADTNGIYLVTGNGSLGNGGTSESVLRIGPTGSGYFIPDNWQTLNNNDWDFGASGPLLIPGTNLLAVGGKAGMLFLLNRTNLGGLTQGNTGAVQAFQATPACTSTAYNGCSEIHHMAYWYRTNAAPLLYMWAYKDVLKAYAMGNGVFNTTPVAQNTALSNFPGGMLALSSNGTAAGSGILWAVTGTQAPVKSIAPGVLHAFDASNVATELWNSSMNASDNLGNMAKFVPPTVANGKVIVATFSNQLMVYGLH